MQKDAMELVLSLGPASRKCPWSIYALFRDNVQHFLEGGQVSPRFRALHSLEQAVAEGLHSVDAARLRGEVLRAVFALGKLRLQDAAISLRSRAILTGGSLPRRRGTVRAGQVRWALPVEAPAEARLLDVVKPFIAAVLAVTETAVDGDIVDVRCAGGSSAHRCSSSESNVWKTARRGLASMGVAALLVACGSSAAPPPVAPNEVDRQTRRDEHHAAEPPPIVAPPPAYGNKIVRSDHRSHSRS